jgi:hypothetical protein
MYFDQYFVSALHKNKNERSHNKSEAEIVFTHAKLFMSLAPFIYSH